jgi:hypothetical protein
MKWRTACQDSEWAQWAGCLAGRDLLASSCPDRLWNGPSELVFSRKRNSRSQLPDTLEWAQRPFLPEITRTSREIEANILVTSCCRCIASDGYQGQHPATGTREGFRQSQYLNCYRTCVPARASRWKTGQNFQLQERLMASSFCSFIGWLQHLQVRLDKVGLKGRYRELEIACYGRGASLLVAWEWEG